MASSSSSTQLGVPITPTLTSSSSSASLSPVPSSSRQRGISTTSFADSLASVDTRTSDAIPSKRQDEFERHFKEDIEASFEDGDVPDDCLVVLATQSGDLQAKVLLHGRLYLTRYHLCFRSNILGYKTESIHRLKEVSAVEKGTTAKWIQNAIYVTMAGKEDEGYIGYGSLGDRDAMYEAVVECWKVAAPEKYAAMVAAASTDELATKEEVVDVLTEKTEPVEGDAKTTTGSGETLDELALDTVIPVPLDKLYNLIYHNREFTMEFYEKDQKLTDVVVTDWQEAEGGNKKRSMNYVMHMNNSIGPSKSDCLGSEVIVIADPEKSYEIESETQTPDIPSGKKFKIHTRTCLTHANLHGRPATRMYCTTQCDWSSSSWLKGTITPAVIKGQKEYHQKLTKKLRAWIKDHPEEFGEDPGVDAAEEGTTAGETVDLNDDVEVASNQKPEKSLFDQAMEISENPVMLGLVGLLVVLLLALLWERSRGQAGVPGKEYGLVAENVHQIE